MKRELLSILVANGVAGIVLYLVERWRKDLFFAVVGIWIIVLPAIFGWFDGRTNIIHAICAPLGVLLIAADMKEKLPGRTAIRRKLGIRGPE